MRVALTADFHGRVLPDVPECDLLVYAGDIGGEQFAFGPFQKWLEEVPAKDVVGVAGNHDWWAMPSGWADAKIQDILHESLAYNLPWAYLYNESYTTEEGLVVWGSPFTNRFMDWAFMAEENGLDQVWATMPDETHLVVTHGPPYGCCDRVARTIPDPSVGSTSLLERLTAAPNVRWAVCGHIHEGYGTSRIVRPDNSHIDVYNVAAVDEHYRPRENSVVLLDLEVPDAAPQAT